MEKSCVSLSKSIVKSKDHVIMMIQKGSSTGD